MKITQLGKKHTKTQPHPTPGQGHSPFTREDLRQTSKVASTASKHVSSLAHRARQDWLSSVKRLAIMNIKLNFCITGQKHPWQRQRRLVSNPHLARKLQSSSPIASPPQDTVQETHQGQLSVLQGPPKGPSHMDQEHSVCM